MNDDADGNGDGGGGGGGDDHDGDDGDYDDGGDGDGDGYGHYTALLCSSLHDKWYHCNDSAQRTPITNALVPDGIWQQCI